MKAKSAQSPSASASSPTCVGGRRVSRRARKACSLASRRWSRVAEARGFVAAKTAEETSALQFTPLTHHLSERPPKKIYRCLRKPQKDPTNSSNVIQNNPDTSCLGAPNTDDAGGKRCHSCSHALDPSVSVQVDCWRSCNLEGPFWRMVVPKTERLFQCSVLHRP